MCWHSKTQVSKYAAPWISWLRESRTRGETVEQPLRPNMSLLNQARQHGLKQLHQKSMVRQSPPNHARSFATLCNGLFKMLARLRDDVVPLCWWT